MQWKIRETMKNDPSPQYRADPNKLPDVMGWFASLDKSPVQVVRLAWEHRKASPIIMVQGGINARLATARVIPRSIWGDAGIFDGYGAMGYEARFAQADFDPDVHYFAIISMGHPGLEDWPVANPRMRFPLPPDQMDLRWEVTAVDVE
mmetsp:Transcript_14618/g.37353  ORF Transcript_14618/g.37353 Transcript_14618/m.37353 type:complete len:148 (+) Transcript_14618:325-768(+)